MTNRGICTIRKRVKPVTLCRGIEDWSVLSKPATVSKESWNVFCENKDARDTATDDDPEGDEECEVEPAD